MKRSTALAVAVLAAAVGPGASTNHAQDGKDMAKGSGAMMMGPGMIGDCPMMERMSGRVRRMMGGDMQELADQRLATLKTQLAITPEQQATWDTYAAALKKNLTGMQAMRQTMQTAMSAKSPVERLDMQVTAMESRLAALKEAQPALSDLYAALSDGQKKKADRTVGCMM
jgi:LTXXQ motif family protein